MMIYRKLKVFEWFSRFEIGETSIYYQSRSGRLKIRKIVLKAWFVAILGP